MASAKGVREVAHFDCAGGGQIVVEAGIAYIGHMASPHGTTIVDVSDPQKPRKLAEITIPAGIHSHKVRAVDGVMLVNREPLHGKTRGPEARTGLGIYDVSDPAKPREITLWECGGVHRFTFDGRYAYLSPVIDGYRDGPWGWFIYDVCVAGVEGAISITDR